MEPRVTETTNPATAEFGMRTFDVRLTDAQIIEIAIAQRVSEKCPGETHSKPAELLISNQVTRNDDLRTAIGCLAATFVSAPAKALSL